MSERFYISGSSRYAYWITRVDLYLHRKGLDPCLPEFPGAILLILDRNESALRLKPPVCVPIGSILKDHLGEFQLKAHELAKKMMKSKDPHASDHPRSPEDPVILRIKQHLFILSGGIPEVNEAILLYVALHDSLLTREEAVEIAKKRKNLFAKELLG